MWTVLTILVAAAVTAPGDTLLLHQERFDTPPSSNRVRYDLSFAEHRFESGHLVLLYSTRTTSLPSGVECIPPESQGEISEQELDLGFLGGGSESSNSLLISYALSPGDGLCLPPFGYGGAADRRSGARSGYILRFLRHGDGVNEVVVYRNDTGWVKKLKNVPMASNPITSLRRVVIRHRQSGEHLVAATFDTGSIFSASFGFEDGRYPPSRRRFQVIAKAHSATGFIAPVRMVAGAWTVREWSETSAPSRRTTSKPRRPENPNSQIPDDPDLLDRMGLDEMSRENYSDAFNHLSRAMDLRKRRHGVRHLKVAESLRHLGRLHRVRDTEEAGRLYQQAFDMVESIAGPADPALAECIEDMAGYYKSVGDNHRAADFYKHAGRIWREKRETQDRMANCMIQLANIYLYDLKQFQAAEQLYLQAMTIIEKQKGPTHPDLVKILSDLAVLYGYQGRCKEEEGLIGRWLEIMSPQLGMDHPDVANRLQLLALHRCDQKQYEVAEPILKHVLSVRERALGPRHTSVAAVLDDLALLYEAQGRWADATALYARELSILKETIHDGDPIIGQISERMAVARKQMKSKRPTASPAARPDVLHRRIENR